MSVNAVKGKARYGGKPSEGVRMMKGRKRGSGYRVARGLEETWGRDRNSSRSMVPELSCKMLSNALLAYCYHVLCPAS